MKRNDGTTRGQTTIDFAIGIGVFLVALTTVVAFVPSIVQPFTGGQETPLVADRLVTQLVDYQLGDPAAPSILNATCTMYFFNESSGDPCPSFDGSDPVTEKLGLPDSRLVNVTLEANATGSGDTETLCGDGSGALQGYLGDGSCAASDVLAVGPDPPDTGGSVTTARRKVLLGDRSVFVVVRIWA